MAKIIEYRDIRLDALVIGKGQVRVENVGQGIDDLAKSIDTQGLLQPIVVCEAIEAEKYEILTGQRRFLAHQRLGRETITAAVLDERVEEEQAKAISITENLMRRKLSGKELIDGITYLYNTYGGSVEAVTKATGLSPNNVRQYVKYPRLIPELQKKVNDGLDIKVALKAQDAATQDQEVNPEVAIKLAQEMPQMSGAQRDKIVQERKNRPDKPIDDVIEDAKTSSKIIQVVATVTQNTHIAIQKFASEEGYKQPEAAAVLIEEALIGRGLLEE